MCHDVEKLHDYLSWINTETYEPIPTRLEEALYDEAKADFFHVGNEIMASILDDLHLIDTEWKTRSRIQKRIHHSILSTVAPFIYKSSYRSHHKEILEWNNMETALSGTFMKLPRRGGKTEAAAQMAATLMKNIPGLILSIIGPGGRQVKGKGSIKSLIREIVENVYKLKITNTDECIIYEPTPGDVRKIFALPGGSPNTYVHFSQVSSFANVSRALFPLLVDSNIRFRAAPIFTLIDKDTRGRHRSSTQSHNAS